MLWSMHTAAKRVWLGVVSLIAVIAAGVASVFTAALALGATALIVPGTGTPNPDIYPEYVQNARNYYLRDSACGEPGACLDLGENLIGIDYPASFWPLTFIPGWCTTNCQKWNVSVGEGVANLQTALASALTDLDNPGQDVVIYGHSQGAGVVSNTLSILGTSLTNAEKERVQVVVTGNVDNPAGGMWSRIGFLGRIPILDLTTGLPTPINTGIEFTSIAMQYDGASNAPKYWGNLLAVANAVAGFAYLHGTTLIPDERTPAGVPDFYPNIDDYLAAVYDPANAKHDDYGNTYIVVPSPVLPIVMPFLDIAARIGVTWLVKPVVDLVSPVLRVLIDLGYDPDENPGVYSHLSILPFSLKTNPFKVGVDLVEAVFQGIHDAIHGGSPLPVPPKVSLGAAPPTASLVTESDDVDAEASTTTSRTVPPVEEEEPGPSLETDVIESTGSDVIAEPAEKAGPADEESTQEVMPDSTDEAEIDEGSGSVDSTTDDGESDDAQTDDDDDSAAAVHDQNDNNTDTNDNDASDDTSENAAA
jgi:hypothetical protein